MQMFHVQEIPLKLRNAVETHRVRAGDAQERQFGESRVTQVVVDTDDDAFARLEVLRIQYDTRRLQSVDRRTGRESETVAVDGIFLGIIADSVAEVDGIGRAVAQAVGKLYEHAFAARLDVRRALLRRRHQQVRADGVQILKNLAQLGIESEVYVEVSRVLDYQRKKTTQKVNLYEKVQIPGYNEAIRKIKRYMEDAENLDKASQKIVKNKHILEEEAEYGN